jgi:transcription-repair coupling factor (superfamily II helicase)
MLLTPLLDELARDRRFAALASALDGAARGTVQALEGVPAAARPPVLAALARERDRPLLVVTARQDAAARLHESLGCFLAAGDEALLWPAPDALPYEQLAVDPAAAAARLALLARLLRARDGEEAGGFVLVASARGLQAQVMTPAALRAGRDELRPGRRLAVGPTLARWIARGYEPVSTVEEVGQFSRRGGLIDVWPPGVERPVRIELFDDEIDALRPFDPLTQRSSGRLTALTILPASELPLWEREAALARLRALDTASLRPEVAAEWDRLLRLLEGGEAPPAQDLLAPYFTPEPAGLFDYLAPETPVVLDEAGAVRLAAGQTEAQAEELRLALESGGELPRGLRRPYHTRAELEARLGRHPALYLGQRPPSTPAAEREAVRVHAWDWLRAPKAYNGRVEELAADLAEAGRAGRRTVLVTENGERLRELLAEHDLFPAHVGAGERLPAPLPPLTLARGGLADGWLYDNAECGVRNAESGGGEASAAPNVVSHAPDSAFRTPHSALAVLTDRDIFGTVRPSRRPSRRTPAQHQAFARALVPGQFVVHLEHGIARYAGPTTMAVGDASPGGPAATREFLVLEYAAGDRLYVPIDQTDRVAPYTGAGDGEPSLNRLGSPEWARTKSRVKGAVADIADELIALYATREATPGHAFAPDTTWDRALAESFPYVETEDQWRAIEEVKADMERPRPMDRLVAGDVGYGKTEVALRAAFKAVNDGTQVAVLVPTTVLALQHARTFKERLAPFPARVEMLSRLRPAAEREAVKRGLADGAVDIVVGTHALLGDDVRFRNLGLLIVDEEQRFGVVHKERLKRLRATVDVLTMSATPIPRTLHLSLAGIRDLSTIDTPPEDRLPIRTFVTPYDDTLVREVILREIERGGQIYFVHNRVRTLQMVAARLRELVPEAHFVVGHGQMEQGQLEKVMLAFLKHEYDVLVCTTIIESGLDLPNVNTIVIDDAPYYGLTQLHQLRGRVGRATNRAYAYLLYREGQPLTAEAQERLETIQGATELGAGFKIAMKDLELRGAGNLLGAEQSGHIAAVGFDLYVQLLAAAVEERRTGVPVQEERPVLLDLPLTALLPNDYIADPATRVREYRRLAAVRAQPELDDLLRELADRFGPLPDEVRALGFLAQIKLQAVALGLEAVTLRDGTLTLRPVPTAGLDQLALRRAFGAALFIGPTSLRLNTRDLRLGWEEALDRLLGALQESKRRLSAAAERAQERAAGDGGGDRARPARRDHRRRRAGRGGGSREAAASD